MADPLDQPSASSWPPPAERLVIIAAGLLAFCAITLAVGIFVLAQLQAEGVREGLRARDMRNGAYSLLQASVDAAAAQRGYIVTNDERFVESYRTNRQAVAIHITRLERLAQGDERFLAILQQVESAEASATSIIDAGIALKEDRANARQLSANVVETDRAMDFVRTEIAEALRVLERRSEAIRIRNASGRSALYWSGGVLVALAFGASLLTIWAIRHERRGWRAALAVMVRANSESEIARQKSAASDLAKTRFLAAASHDMRQPLHALTLYLSALQRRVENPEAQGILTKMERAVQSMIGMFSTLLDLARIQADVVKPEITTFPLQDVLDRVIAEHPGADLKGPAPPTPLQALSDPVLLERMLRNLVSNALKHGGGAARIEVQRTDGHAEIAVIDNGPGIPEEDQERVFDEFVRLDGRASAEGLGLGLAIVKRIADLLHADIKLHSKPGEGARFVVRIPIAAVASSTREAAPEPARIAGVPILVMDDEPLALEAATGALRDLGAEVRAVANEAELNAVLQGGYRPRLLVMDLRIDGILAGVDIAERARARLTPPPHVIMMTGDTAPETLARLRASGHSWLIKPVSRDDLAAAVAATPVRADA